MAQYFDEMLSCKEFASRVGVSDTLIRQWVQMGALACNRVGPTYIFHPDQVADALKLRDAAGATKARRNDLFRPLAVGSVGPMDLVELEQAGAVIGRTAMTLRRWVELGRLPGYRVRGRSCVSLSDAQAIAAGKTDAAADPEELRDWVEA